MLAAVDEQRIVQASGAQPVAQPGVHRVGARTGIDEERRATQRGDDRESVGMRVTPVQEAMAAGIEIASSPGARETK